MTTSASSSAALPSSPDRIEGPRDLAALHRDVWAIMCAHPLLFVLLPALVWLPFDLFGELAALRSDDLAQQMRTMIRVSNLGSVVVGTLVAGMFAASLKRMGAGEQVRVRTAFADGSPLWGSVFRVWFVVGIVSVLAMVLLVLPGIYLLVCWSLVVPVVVFERLGTDAAMKRSRELVRARGFFTVLGYILAIYVVYLVLTAVPAIGIGLFVEELGHPLLGAIVNAVLAAGTNVVLSALTIGATLVYVDASGTRALWPVGPDLLRADGSRIPTPTSGRRGFITASVAAGILLAVSMAVLLVTAMEEIEAEEAAAADAAAAAIAVPAELQVEVPAEVPPG